MNVLRACGVDIRIEGLEHVRAEDGPVVFIANHMSTLETFLLPSLIAPIKPVTFVVKESLTTYPIFGHVMRARDPVTVGRVNPREDYAAVMEGGSRRLGGGISMIIFPQAVRSARFEPENFNTLGVKLARRAGVPVQPIALRSDAWGNGRRLKDLGRIDPSLPVRFRFAPPMPVTGNGSAEHEWIVAYIRACLAEWGA
jgi:1-acyl-sn-glycerol-3-phosphate acyltransferase